MEPKEKEYTLKYKESELIAEAQSLEQDEEVKLFLAVQRGADKYSKYIDILSIIEKKK